MTSSQTPTKPYDLLLKNGHVIDPHNHIDGARDVAISGNTLWFSNSGGLVQGWDISGLATGVQGVMIPTRVTSVREVTWASFTPNFFASSSDAIFSAMR